MPSRIFSPSLPLLVSLAGCSYYDASLLDPAEQGASDAATDAVLDASHEAGEDVVADAPVDTVVDVPDSGDVVNETQTCAHARPPDPPMVTDAGGDIEFTVAVSSVDFGDLSGDPGRIGYDLDGRCTCQGEGNGCLRESWATADACDGPEGRDNLTGDFVSKMAVLVDNFGSEAWSAGVIAGEWSLLLRVRDYNGQAEDDRVRLEWHVPDQYWEDKPDSSHVPAWDGEDTWPIRASTLIEQSDGTFDTDKPKYFDEHAYVTGGVLVGSLTETVLQLSADYAVEFNGAFITAKVVQGSTGWVLEDGLLAARWKLNTILGQLSRLSLLNMPVCTNHPAYASLKAQICAYADIYSGVAAPSTPCDSISTGMQFEAQPAGFGAIIDNEAEPSPCAPNVDPRLDSCDTLGP